MGVRFKKITSKIFGGIFKKDTKTSLEGLIISSPAQSNSERNESVEVSSDD